MKPIAPPSLRAALRSALKNARIRDAVMPVEPHRLERRRRHEQERHARLLRHRLRHERLAGPRRPLEQDARAGGSRRARRGTSRSPRNTSRVRITSSTCGSRPLISVSPNSICSGWTVMCGERPVHHRDRHHHADRPTITKSGRKQHDRPAGTSGADPVVRREPAPQEGVDQEDDRDRAKDLLHPRPLALTEDVGAPRLRCEPSRCAGPRAFWFSFTVPTPRRPPGIVRGQPAKRYIGWPHPDISLSARSGDRRTGGLTGAVGAFRRAPEPLGCPARNGGIEIVASTKRPPISRADRTLLGSLLRDLRRAAGYRAVESAAPTRRGVPRRARRSTQYERGGLRPRSPSSSSWSSSTCWGPGPRGPGRSRRPTCGRRGSRRSPARSSSPRTT